MKWQNVQSNFTSKGLFLPICHFPSANKTWSA
uniref:Uncharacterized protein n=1 Tax=Arundo donax TaxID=35708 RepID=A0A0A9HJY3_ARUDO